jgi:hypothetical protein
MTFATVFANIRASTQNKNNKHKCRSGSSSSGVPLQNPTRGPDLKTRRFFNLPNNADTLPRQDLQQRQPSIQSTGTGLHKPSRKQKMYVDRPAPELTAATKRPILKSNYSQIDWVDVSHRLRSCVRDEVFWYQKLAFVFVISRRGIALVADEAGLGKSYVAMMSIEYYASSLNPAVHPWPVLILVPAVMKREWINKIRQRMQLPPLDPPEPELTSTKRFKKQVHLVSSSKDTLDKTTVRIVVCSYGTAKIEPMYSQLMQFGFKMCICDESQEMRSPPKHVMGAGNLRGGSLVTEKVQPLVQSCIRRIFLTGTPSGGSGAHYQPQVHALRPDISGWANYWEFGKRYGKPHLRMTSACNDVLLFKGTTNRSELHADLRTHVMHRLKSSDQLRTEDEMARLEVRSRLEHQHVEFQYTSDGLKWATRSLTPAELSGTAPEASFVFSKATHDMIEAGKEGSMDSPDDADDAGDKQGTGSSTRIGQTREGHTRKRALDGCDTGGAGRHYGGATMEGDGVGMTPESTTRAKRRRQLYASVEAKAHAVGIQGRVVRNRKVHWIKPPMDVTLKLMQMAVEEEELAKTLKVTHNEWINERAESNDRHVRLEHGSVDFAAAEVRQRRNELFRRTAMIKIKAARHHLREYISSCVRDKEKVIVMAYHRTMMDTCEGIIREALGVHDQLPRLTPGPSKNADKKSASIEAQSAWQSYCGRLDQQEQHDEITELARGVHIPANDRFTSKRRCQVRQKRLQRNRLSNKDRRAILPYIRLDGSVTNKATVQASIDRFQKDDTCLVGVLSIPKACTGITLTAGTRMVFVELTHRADQLLQAEARIDRRGQTSESVEIVYMLLKSSIESQVWRRDIAKMDHAAFVSDGRAEGFRFKSAIIDCE